MTRSPIGASPAIANLHRLQDPTLSSVEGEDMDSRELSPSTSAATEKVPLPPRAEGSVREALRQLDRLWLADMRHTALGRLPDE